MIKMQNSETPKFGQKTGRCFLNSSVAMSNSIKQNPNPDSIPAAFHSAEKFFFQVEAISQWLRVRK